MCCLNSTAANSPGQVFPSEKDKYLSSNGAMFTEYMSGQKGFIKIFYIIALFFLGVLIWGFFQSKTGNLSGSSVALDSELTDALTGAGFTNSDIVSQSREERRSGTSVWVEYYRELKLNNNVKLSELENNVRLLAKKHNYSFIKSHPANDKVSYELFNDKKLFSKIILDTPKPEPEPRAQAHGLRIAVVIDDVGYKDNLGPFLDLGIPLTFAILPYEHFSKQIAAELSKKGMPYILHLPLEPEQYPKVDPGKAALLVKMTSQEIEKKFLSDLSAVPGVVGVNNHMGSRFTSNPEKMRVLLKLIKDKNLFFFDSATSTATKGGMVAREIGIPFEENSMFVDLKDDPVFMDKQFKAALRKIKRYGQCAVIGHIHKKYMPAAFKVGDGSL